MRNNNNYSTPSPPKMPNDPAKTLSWIRRFDIFFGSDNLTHILTTIPSTGPVDVISCNDRLFLERMHGVQTVRDYCKVWQYLLEATCNTDIEEKLAACNSVLEAWGVVTEWTLPVTEAEKTLLVQQFGERYNVPPNSSVFRDKGLAEMAKKVCIVNAAGYNYFRSVRGESVTQTLVGYKNLKTSLPSDVYVGRAFHGQFWYNIARNIRQTLPQTTTGTHPTCPHGAHSRSSSSHCCGFPFRRLLPL